MIYKGRAFRRGRQRWLLGTFGVTAILGAGYVVYHHQQLNDFLLGQVGGQCETRTSSIKRVTDFTNITAVGTSKSLAEKARVTNLAKSGLSGTGIGESVLLNLSCKPLQNVEEIKLICPSGCSAASDYRTSFPGNPYCELLPGEPRLVKKPGRNLQYVWSATARCRATCEYTRTCTTAAIQLPFKQFSCYPKTQTVEAGKTVAVYEDATGGKFNATWTTDANDASKKTGTGNQFYTSFGVPGTKTITATSIDFPGAVKTDTCTVTVIRAAATMPTPTPSVTLAPTPTPRPTITPTPRPATPTPRPATVTPLPTDKDF